MIKRADLSVIGDGAAVLEALIEAVDNWRQGFSGRLLWIDREQAPAYDHTAKQMRPPPYKCAAERRSPRNITPHRTPKGGIRKVTVSERIGPISAIKRKYRIYAHAVQMKPNATSAIHASGLPQLAGGFMAVEIPKNGTRNSVAPI